MIDKMTIIMEMIVNIQEVVLILYTAEDGKEKQKKLKECANKIKK